LALIQELNETVGKTDEENCTKPDLGTRKISNSKGDNLEEQIVKYPQQDKLYQSFLYTKKKKMQKAFEIVKK
jgi:hypothetical protein